MVLGPRKYQKSIEFDLDTNGLREYYASYTQAYDDIGRFMRRHGFEHRQGSVYNSMQKILETDIIDLAEDLRNTFPWAETCIKALDVTNVSRQHSLLSYLHEPDLSEVIQQTYEPNQTYEYID